MKKVVALQTWSNGIITMDEKSVMGIDDALADSLIAAGICADAETYFGTGGGGESYNKFTWIDDNVFHDTWDTIKQSIYNFGTVVVASSDAMVPTDVAIVDRVWTENNLYYVHVSGWDMMFACDSYDGYPEFVLN